MTQQWFVISTKLYQEELAVTNVRASLNFHAFYPTKSCTIHHARRREQAIRPLIPRYIFAQFDRAIDNWGAIRQTRGCIDVLKNGSSEVAQPSPVRSSVIEALMAADETTVPDASLGFSAGERIFIKVGPWANLPATFLGEEGEDAEIIVEMFGHAFTKTLPIKHLAKRLVPSAA